MCFAHNNRNKIAHGRTEEHTKDFFVLKDF